VDFIATYGNLSYALKEKMLLNGESEAGSTIDLFVMLLWRLKILATANKINWYHFNFVEKIIILLFA
jgi:hypothetical protein